LGTFPGTFFFSPHPSSTYPIAPGDIEAFKGMPLTEMNLRECGKLTGVWVECVGLGWAVGDWKQVLPQGLA